MSKGPANAGDWGLLMSGDLFQPKNDNRPAQLRRRRVDGPRGPSVDCFDLQQTILRGVCSTRSCSLLAPNARSQVTYVRWWPIASFRGDAAIQSLSERSGHSASRADRTGFMSTRPNYPVIR